MLAYERVMGSHHQPLAWGTSSATPRAADSRVKHDRNEPTIAYMTPMHPIAEGAPLAPAVLSSFERVRCSQPAQRTAGAGAPAGLSAFSRVSGDLAGGAGAMVEQVLGPRSLRTITKGENAGWWEGFRSRLEGIQRPSATAPAEEPRERQGVAASRDKSLRIVSRKKHKDKA